MEFICTECGHKWSREPDNDGLFDGYGLPPCPICGGFSCDANDYGDFHCPRCGHRFRRYGNGGLIAGMWPSCPKCGFPTPDEV